jgi:hypothetical protein
MNNGDEHDVSPASGFTVSDSGVLNVYRGGALIAAFSRGSWASVMLDDDETEGD